MTRQWRNACPLCGGTHFRSAFRDWQGNAFLRCRDCTLVIQNPVAAETAYDEGYWGDVIDPDGRRRNLMAERRERLANWYGEIPAFINAMPPSRILDAGCGPGHLLSGLAGHHSRYGIDPSVRCVAHIAATDAGVRVSRAPIESFRAPENHFDVVVCYHVIEHLLSPRQAMERMYGLLKKGGILIIGTPNIGSPAARWFRGNFRLLGTPHVTLFSEKTLAILLEQTGFRVFRREFPFFKTNYFTAANLARMLFRSRLSPPFYKSIMTFYAKKGNP